MIGLVQEVQPEFHLAIFGAAISAIGMFAQLGIGISNANAAKRQTKKNIEQQAAEDWQGRRDALVNKLKAFDTNVDVLSRQKDESQSNIQALQAAGGVSSGARGAYNTRQVALRNLQTMRLELTEAGQNLGFEGTAETGFGDIVGYGEIEKSLEAEREGKTGTPQWNSTTKEWETKDDLPDGDPNFPKFGGYYGTGDSWFHQSTDTSKSRYHRQDQEYAYLHGLEKNPQAGNPGGAIRDIGPRKGFHSARTAARKRAAAGNRNNENLGL